MLEKTQEGRYRAYIPELPGCIASAKSIKDTKDKIRKSVEFHLYLMLEEELDIPEKFMGKYELEFYTDIPSLFNWFSGIISKSGVSKLTSMNPSLISQYASGSKTPSRKQAKKIEQALHNLGRELLEVNLCWSGG